MASRGTRTPSPAVKQHGAFTRNERTLPTAKVGLGLMQSGLLGQQRSKENALNPTTSPVPRDSLASLPPIPSLTAIEQEPLSHRSSLGRKASDTPSSLARTSSFSSNATQSFQDDVLVELLRLEDIIPTEPASAHSVEAIVDLSAQPERPNTRASQRSVHWSSEVLLTNGEQDMLPFETSSQLPVIPSTAGSNSSDSGKLKPIPGLQVLLQGGKLSPQWRQATVGDIAREIRMQDTSQMGRIKLTNGGPDWNKQTEVLSATYTGSDISHIRDSSPTRERSPTRNTRIPAKFQVMATSPIPHLMEKVNSSSLAEQHIDERNLFATRKFPSHAPSGRQEAMQLTEVYAVLLQELEENVQKLRTTESADDNVNLDDAVELLRREQVHMQVLKQEQKMCDVIISEIIRQVEVNCVERGVLLKRVAGRYRDMIRRLLQYAKQAMDTVATAVSEERHTKENHAQQEKQIQHLKELLYRTGQQNESAESTIRFLRHTLKRVQFEKQQEQEHKDRALAQLSFLENSKATMQEKQEVRSRHVVKLREELSKALKLLVDTEQAKPFAQKSRSSYVDTLQETIRMINVEILDETPATSEIGIQVETLISGVPLQHSLSDSGHLADSMYGIQIRTYTEGERRKSVSSQTQTEDDAAEPKASSNKSRKHRTSRKSEVTPLEGDNFDFLNEPVRDSDPSDVDDEMAVASDSEIERRRQKRVEQLKLEEVHRKQRQERAARKAAQRAARKGFDISLVGPTGDGFLVPQSTSDLLQVHTPHSFELSAGSSQESLLVPSPHSSSSLTHLDSDNSLPRHGGHFGQSTVVYPSGLVVAPTVASSHDMATGIEEDYELDRIQSEIELKSKPPAPNTNMAVNILAAINVAHTGDDTRLTVSADNTGGRVSPAIVTNHVGTGDADDTGTAKGWSAPESQYASPRGDASLMDGEIKPRQRRVSIGMQEVQGEKPTRIPENEPSTVLLTVSRRSSNSSSDNTSAARATATAAAGAQQRATAGRKSGGTAGTEQGQLHVQELSPFGQKQSGASRTRRLDSVMPQKGSKTNVNSGGRKGQTLRVSPQPAAASEAPSKPPLSPNAAVRDAHGQFDQATQEYYDENEAGQSDADGSRRNSRRPTTVGSSASDPFDDTLEMRISTLEAQLGVANASMGSQETREAYLARRMTRLEDAMGGDPPSDDEDDDELRDNTRASIAPGYLNPTKAGREARQRKKKTRLLTLLKGEYSKRPVKPLSWMLRIINQVYEDKYAADRSNDRAGQQRIAMPEFIVDWVGHKYGLKALVDQACWDVFNAMKRYRAKDLSVEMFARFVDEDLTTEHLLFYLDTRNIVVDTHHSKSGAKEATVHPDILPLEQASEVARKAFASADASLKIRIVTLIESHTFKSETKPYVGRKVISTAKLYMLMVDEYVAEQTKFEAKMDMLFSIADDDENGYVDHDEFVQMMKQAMPQLAESQATRFFVTATGSPDNSGKLTRAEFRELVRREKIFSNYNVRPPTQQQYKLSEAEMAELTTTVNEHWKTFEPVFRKVLARFEQQTGSLNNEKLLALNEGLEGFLFELNKGRSIEAMQAYRRLIESVRIAQLDILEANCIISVNTLHAELARSVEDIMVRDSSLSRPSSRVGGVSPSPSEAQLVALSSLGDSFALKHGFQQQMHGFEYSPKPDIKLGSAAQSGDVSVASMFPSSVFFC
eukprot:TRINITY_DN333_c0_g2_i5.p1 TRINITY_DN333_c0_g2~~TRINITY_DN333_c0_g2_i5.p1  ORF type:complete len:1685 (-),score=405.16 TRINITY_DN333_c0_g2_i5:1830-6884(-)